MATCGRCHKDEKVFADGFCGICQIAISGKSPGVIVRNNRKYTRAERQLKTLEFLNQKPVGHENHIDNRTAEHYKELFVDRTRRIEQHEAAIDPGVKREIEQQEDHEEKTMVDAVVKEAGKVKRDLATAKFELGGVKYAESA